MTHVEKGAVVLAPIRPADNIQVNKNFFIIKIVFDGYLIFIF